MRAFGSAPRPLPPALPRAPLGQWILATAAGVVLTTAAGHALGAGAAGPAWAGVAFLAAATGIARALRRHYPHPRLGACNVATLARAALACALLAPLAEGRGAGWTVALVATAALALDGADGWLARRSGLVSRFGARFDMETDAALALILSLHVLVGTAVGPEALLLGLMRYVFLGASLIAPWLAADLPPRLGRKTICVIQMAALILLLTPMPDPGQAIWLARATAALLVASFGVDIWWLWRHRP